MKNKKTDNPVSPSVIPSPSSSVILSEAKNLARSFANTTQDDNHVKFKFSIKRFPELESTNTLAQKMAAEGAPEGLVIVTDFQTGGRGKPGREWVSPRGKNLLFSLLIRPKIAVSKAPLITQIACRSVQKVLEKNGIASTLKKPNDVMIDGKKICGVLTESSATQTELHSVIIGIGLNVNAEGTELIPEAVSMKMVSGKTFDLTSLLSQLLETLKKDLDDLYAARI